MSDEMRRSGSRARRQAVPDFLEQDLRPCRLRWDRRFGCFLTDEPCGRFSEPEHNKGDNQEIDDRIDEQANVEGRGASFLCRVERRVVLAVQGHEYVAEIDAPDRDADQRIDDVLDEAVHDTREGYADDNAYRQIDDIAARDKGAELSHPPRRR